MTRLKNKGYTQCKRGWRFICAQAELADPQLYNFD